MPLFIEGVETGVIPKRFAYVIALRISSGERVTCKDLNVRSFNDLDDSLRMILVAYNRSIAASSMAGEDKTEYYDALQTIETQRKELAGLRIENASLQGTVSSLRDEIENVKEENKAYVKSLGTIHDALKTSGFKRENLFDIIEII